MRNMLIPGAYVRRSSTQAGSIPINRGHTGGRWGKGGDILFRWGNPRGYRNGTKVEVLNRDKLGAGKPSASADNRPG